MKKILTILALVPNLALAITFKDLNNQKPPFTLPKLQYGYADLAPHFDEQTMTIHHTKHHQAYVDNANAALKADAEPRKLIDILRNLKDSPAAVRNNAGGHWNHAFFWSVLTPSAKQKKVPAKLMKQITKDFGSFEKFQEEFETKAKSVFGSGWAWLVVDENNKLAVVTTPNQDNPLMDVSPAKGKPILALDVWEHAYYLAYQNKRVDYIKSFWNVINWEQVDKFYSQKI